MDANQNCAFVQVYRGRRLWILDEWEMLRSFFSATEAQICDALNPIYGPNHSLAYYGMCSTPGCGPVRTSGPAETSKGRRVHGTNFDE